MKRWPAWLSPLRRPDGVLQVDEIHLEATMGRMAVGDEIIAHANYDAIRVRAARLGISVRIARSGAHGYAVKRTA